MKGLIPPMVTPLIDNNTLDRDGTVRLVEHMIAGGVHGIFILGTTGEAQSLAYHLRYELTELVCSAVAGRVPVLVGVTDTSLEESLRLAHKAAECGAAAVVAAPPYYFAPSQPELTMYYKALADNMPVHVKVSLEPATVKELAGHPNIIGLKDSSSNMVYFQTLLYELSDRPDFALFMGPEQLTAESVMLGAAGGVNGGANVFPELYVALYEAAAANDLGESPAASCHGRRRVALYHRSLWFQCHQGNQVRTFAHGDMQRLPFISLPAIPRCRTDEGAGRARKTAGADPDLTPAMSWQE